MRRDETRRDETRWDETRWDESTAKKSWEKRETNFISAGVARVHNGDSFSSTVPFFFFFIFGSFTVFCLLLVLVSLSRCSIDRLGNVVLTRLLTSFRRGGHWFLEHRSTTWNGDVLKVTIMRNEKFLFRKIILRRNGFSEGRAIIVANVKCFITYVSSLTKICFILGYTVIIYGRFKCIVVNSIIHRDTYVNNILRFAPA